MSAAEPTVTVTEEPDGSLCVEASFEGLAFHSRVSGTTAPSNHLREALKMEIAGMVRKLKGPREGFGAFGLGDLVRALATGETDMVIATDRKTRRIQVAGSPEWQDHALFVPLWTIPKP